MKIFIASTDTDIGKTYVACHLLRQAARAGKRTLGIKPIASGCYEQDGELINHDAEQLRAASSVACARNVLNPIRLAPPVSPHIAAEQSGTTLNTQSLLECIQPALAHPADLYLIEGAGGWHAPLNTQETYADFVKLAKLPVLLVVGMKLGCLNHALLTYQSMQFDNIECIGWIANCIDPNMRSLKENIDTLKARLNAPLWEILPYDPAGQHDTFRT